MKFRIERTSYFDNQKPCEQAYQDGKDKYGYDIWVVDINTLEDLLSLKESVGEELIVGDGYIEIYDDYRE